MENNLVDTIELNDKVTVKIYTEDYPQSPREWDNLGTMVCWHNRYDLGDKHNFDSSDDLYDWLQENKSVVLPLYLYDHSGITMNTGGFYDHWDSGQVGYIYVTYEDLRKEYGYKYITAKRIAKAREYLKIEVETYDQYLTGDVYGFKLICNECEEEIDSCWGFFGQDYKENGMQEYFNENAACDNCNVPEPEYSI